MFDTYLADILPLYLKCLGTGRPPNFTLAYVDCRFPESENANEKGVTDLNAACMWSCALFAIDSPFLFFSLNLPAVETWNYRFAAECVAEVAARTLAAEIPSYARSWSWIVKCATFPYLNVRHMELRWLAPCRPSPQKSCCQALSPRGVLP